MSLKGWLDLRMTPADGVGRDRTAGRRNRMYQVLAGSEAVCDVHTPPTGGSSADTHFSKLEVRGLMQTGIQGAWRDSLECLLKTAREGLAWTQAEGQETERALLQPWARPSHIEGNLNSTR